ncbi:hypothetical protein HYH02_012218 [Chlamydomonas schloesseri]|uniref:Uncharacterized protein n=1 Tax=Chlamydomonas schloesseri TaxID=2026947 RepID=A0A835SZY5_9CHLO|nr:hypothetical protein HYH02_012218 [Chlamydomonas schloesseri]|eukprot:KAG2434552.1 hypothetical protein HYH02_012218 [Chlamydomonas schloesseri]
MEQPHTQLPQQAEQQQAQGRRAQLQQTLLALGVPKWLLARFTVAHLNIILREGFSDLASFQSGATPEAVCLRLEQAGVPFLYAYVIQGALEKTAPVQQWRKQQGLKEGDVASRGGHGGGVGPAAGLLRPAAHTPPHDTDAGHAHDQQPTYGGGTSAFTASKGWWSAWLPSAPLQWSTPPPQPQPLPPPQPPTPGSAGTSPSNEVTVAAVAATASHAASTAPTAERRAVLDDAAHSVPIAAPAAAPASTCRRRHVHRPALGQE